MLTYYDLQQNINCAFPTKFKPNDINVIVSFDDLKNKKYFPLFIFNDKKPLKSVMGLNLDLVDNETNFDITKIKICYITIDNIEIIPSKNVLSSCSNDITLQTLVHLTLHIKIDNQESTTKLTDIIQTKYSINGVNLDGNIWRVNENRTNDEIVYNIETKYFYFGKKYTSKLILTQPKNIISDWIFDYDEPCQMELFSKNGVICSHNDYDFILGATATYKRHFYKKNSIGEIIDKTYYEYIQKDNIINDVDLKSSNPIFEVKGNCIHISQQNINSCARNTIVTAYFDGLECSITLIQEKGLEGYYDYIIEFCNGSKEYEEKLHTSLLGELQIPLSSYRILKVNNIEQLKEKYAINTIKIKNIIYYDNDYDWIDRNIGVYDNTIFINIKNINQDKIKKRIAKIILYDDVNDSNEIALTIIQPELQIKNIFYKLEITNIDVINFDDFKQNDIIKFTPYIHYEYEDGTTEIKKALNNDNYIDFIMECDDDNIVPLYCKRINEMGEYHLKLELKNTNIHNSFYFTVQGRIKDKNDNILCFSKQKETYIIKEQEEENDKIENNITQQKKEIDLKCNIIYNDKKTELWNTNKYKLTICDVESNNIIYELVLSNFFYSPLININKEIVLETQITLYTNKQYLFKISDILLETPYGEYNTKPYFEQTYEINENDKTINIDCEI